MSTAMMDRGGYGGDVYNRRPVAASGLLSNSDEVHQERQRRLRDQRTHDQQEAMRQQEWFEQPSEQNSIPNGHHNSSYAGSHTPSSQFSPRKPQYQRHVTPDQGLPLGRYEQQRKILDDVRHIEYNQIIKEREEREHYITEERKRQSMMNSMAAETHRSNHDDNLYDYEVMRQKNMKAKQEEYQQFVKEKEAQRGLKKPPTPQGGGLPVGGYELKKRLLKNDLTLDYRNSLEKQQRDKLMMQLNNIQTYQVQDMPSYSEIHFHDPEETQKKLRKQMQEEYNREQDKQQNSPRRKPNTPPTGLNIQPQREREFIANERKKQYAKDLTRQIGEQQKSRAQHMLEMPPPPQPNGSYSHHNHQPQIDYSSRDYQAPRLPKEAMSMMNNGPGYAQDSPKYRDHEPQHSPSRYREPQYTPSISGQRFDSRGNHSSDSRQNRPNRQTPSYWDNGMPVKTPMSVSSQGSRASTQQSGRSTYSTPHRYENPTTGLNLDSYKEDPRKEIRKQEQQEGYQRLLAKKAEENSRRAAELDRQRQQPAVKPVYGSYSSAETLENHRSNLGTELKREMQSFSEKSRNDIQRVRSFEGLTSQGQSSDGQLSYVSSHRRRPGTERRERRRRHRRSTSADSAMKYSNDIRMSKRWESTGNLDTLHGQNAQGTRRLSGDFATTSSNYGNASNRVPEYNVSSVKSTPLQPRRRSPEQMGLPLSQKPYDDFHAKQVQIRNREYNELLAKKGVIHGINLMQSGRANKTIKRYLQNKIQSEHPVIQWNSRRGPKERIDPETNSVVTWENGLPIGQHRYRDWHSSLENQRNSEYNRVILKPLETPDDFRPQGKKEGVNFDKQRAFPTGEYEQKKTQFQKDWRKSYQEYADKQRQLASRSQQLRVRSEMSIRENLETPPILPQGEHLEKHKKYNKKMKEAYQNFVKTLPSVNRSKSFWEAEDKPRIIPSSGEHRQRKERFVNERIQEFQQYISKVKTPKPRTKEFMGEKGAVLFEGEYDKVKKKINEDRKKEMMNFYEKKRPDMPRRTSDPAADKHSMLSGIGVHEKDKSKPNHENSPDYKTYLNEVAYPYGPPNGQLYSAGGRAGHAYHPSDDRSQIRHSNSRGQVSNGNNGPSYDEMLENKRREEASYRRYDPEYSRPSESDQRYRHE